MKLTNIGHATILLETKGLRILTDPWLTPRLDRFWEHYPPLRPETVPERVDIVLLSHHHFDHFHLPSIHSLNRDALVFCPSNPTRLGLYPAGGGVFDVAGLLQRLGFTRVEAVEPFQRIEIGEIRITCIPSYVVFPEYTFVIEDGDSSILLAGDSLLHPQTVAWIEEYKPRFDLAVLPPHSISNDACFQHRIPFADQKADDDQVRRRIAALRYRQYLGQIPAASFLPGAFGWWVLPRPVADEPSCHWINRKLFPITLADGYDIGEELGLEMHSWQPGDRIHLRPGGLEGEGPGWDDIDRLRSVCSALECDPEKSLMPFQPERIGPAVSDAQRQKLIEFVEKEAGDRLARVPYLANSLEEGLEIELRITGAEDLRWIARFENGRPTFTPSADRPASYFCWVAESTFSRLLRAETAYPHTWAQWVSNTHLLEALFNQPDFYHRHVDKVLARNDGLKNYGI